MTRKELNKLLKELNKMQDIAQAVDEKISQIRITIWRLTRDRGVK